MFYRLGQLISLALETLRHSPCAWRQRGKILDQLYEVGASSLLMACVLSTFIGAVLALQSGPVLVENAAAGTVGGLIGISMAKELSPVMMAFLLAGRSGSAIAAEIGSMRVSQEIDALKTMGIHPMRYLVVPRVTAMVIALPIVVVFSILSGWIGGAIVSMANPEIQVDWPSYFASIENFVSLDAIKHGILKSAFFAGIIGVVSCQQGLQTEGGPRGVGESVTRAVVYSLALILISDYFVTRVLMAILPE